MSKQDICGAESERRKANDEEYKDEELQERTQAIEMEQHAFHLKCESEIPEGILSNVNKEALQHGAECEQKQTPMQKETVKVELDERPISGAQLMQEKTSMEDWGLDKPLPPIKVRRDGQSRDSSPSDLSPPSPKRMRVATRTSVSWPSES